jgi:protein-tyrosine phosphatase
MRANEIIPNLWLGNIQDSCDDLFIINFDIIINCTKELPFHNEKCKNIRLPIDDNLQPLELDNMYKCLDMITSYIHKELLKGKKIFVHCFGGVQRSATVIIAYLVRYTGLSLDECIKCVLSKRSIIFQPMCNFRPSLDRFINDIKNK